MIRYTCPRCSILLESPDDQSGQKVFCPKCQQKLQIPEPPRNKTILATFAGSSGAPIPAQAEFVPQTNPPPLPPTGLPAFEFSHLPMFQQRSVEFCLWRRGVLASVSKDVKTYVSGGGGGGSTWTDGYGRVQGSTAPIWMRTEHVTTMELWIVDANGAESSVRIYKDIPLREGQEVSVVAARVDQGDSCHCLILNHTARATHFLGRSRSLVTPSVSEITSAVIAFLALGLIGVLISFAGSVAGFFVAAAACLAMVVYFAVRREFLRGRFANHCHGVARMLQ
ncbi:MAG: hypothetical protein FJ271_18135 [Planctomycetes bacterium]|nr:hypothetical protein [Planctomycetota bacterium]